jgi:hypothetical protein
VRGYIDLEEAPSPPWVLDMFLEVKGSQYSGLVVSTDKTNLQLQVLRLSHRLPERCKTAAYATVLSPSGRQVCLEVNPPAGPAMRSVSAYYQDGMLLYTFMTGVPTAVWKERSSVAKVLLLAAIDSLR